MRFTNWSTLKTTFIISAVALLSLIPAANAEVEIVITVPVAGKTYLFGTNQGTNTVTWNISTDDTNVDGVYGSIFLMDGSSIEALPYLLAPSVSLLSDTLGVVEFPVVNPGVYYIEFNTSFGSFTSGKFFLEKPDYPP